MRRSVCLCAAFIAVASLSFAQDAQKVLDTFKRNFAIASLDVKIQILQDAAAGKTASAMGPLFQQAADFVTDNANLIPTDARFNQLAGIAAEQIGVVGYTAGRDSVWKLFGVTQDSQTLAKAAAALESWAPGTQTPLPTSTGTWIRRIPFSHPARLPTWQYLRPASRRWAPSGTPAPFPCSSAP